MKILLLYFFDFPIIVKNNVKNSYRHNVLFKYYYTVKFKFAEELLKNNVTKLIN